MTMQRNQLNWIINRFTPGSKGKHKFSPLKVGYIKACLYVSIFNLIQMQRLKLIATSYNNYMNILYEL